MLAILDSTGEANRLAISDTLTDTLDLNPRGIIVAMTALQGVVTGAEVDTLRLPLAVSDFPWCPGPACRRQTSHPPVRYLPFVPRHPQPFSRFPAVDIIVYCGERAIAQQTFVAYAAYILPKLQKLARSIPRPFWLPWRGTVYTVP